jgi:CTP synthase (UTP-ammonia lyase)
MQQHQRKVSNLDAILVAPGFGERGIEGKKLLYNTLENKVPFSDLFGYANGHYRT